MSDQPDVQDIMNSMQLVLDATRKLEDFNRADSVIANVARDALDDIRTILDSWDYLPGVGFCYKSNVAPAELPNLEKLFQLLSREEEKQ